MRNLLILYLLSIFTLAEAQFSDNSLRKQLDGLNNLSNFCNFYAKNPDMSQDTIFAVMLKKENIFGGIMGLYYAAQCFDKISEENILAAIIKTPLKPSQQLRMKEVFPNMSDKTHDKVMKMYADNSLFHYLNAKEKNTLASYRVYYDAYKGLPDPHNLFEEVSSKIEYLASLESDRIPEIGSYAREHPDKAKEMEARAFALTSERNSKNCEWYLSYFPNTPNRKEVERRLQASKIFERDEPCRACVGSGNCYTCNGRGVTPCKKCNATGRLASGYQCLDCRGKGQYLCTSCDGRGVCPSCRGSKKQFGTIYLKDKFQSHNALTMNAN